MKFSFHLPLPSNINCDKATNSGLIVARTTRVAAEWPAEFPDFDIVAQFTIFTMFQKVYTSALFFMKAPGRVFVYAEEPI